MKKALVVLSGGQDSVTCLGVAMRECDEVEAISFVYGQKHAVEISAASAICATFDLKHTVVCLDFFQDIVTSGLLSPDIDVSEKHPYKSNLPASFVPNRNAMFLTIAHAHAQEIKADRIYTGVCQTDYSGYPDCRNEFIREMEQALNVGYETNIEIITPLMHLTKAETFELAADVGILDTVLDASVTCYNGDTLRKNEWGRGCGECPACLLRAKGWAEYKGEEGACSQ